MTGVRKFDVLIVGGGLVGGSLACALGDGGLSVALVDGTPQGESHESSASVERHSDDWDSRIYAISPASRTFLEAIGVWERLEPARIAACREMVVHGDRAGSRLEFSAYESGVEALAWMLESRSLARALNARLQTCPSVQTIGSARGVSMESGDHARLVRLDDGNLLAAKLVVGADGARSWVREVAGIGITAHDFQQIGVVANYQVERPHHGVAKQWFLPGGEILAYLPLPERRISIVWSAATQHAKALLALPPDQLADAVVRASDTWLGHLTPMGAASGFPLQDLRTETLHADRVALVGDAAHVIHPLAGQGVNLGFGDAQYLAFVIGNREVFRDCGDARLLARYQRGRAEAILAIRSVTRGMQRLFALPGASPAWLRNTGLNLTNRLPVIKSVLARRALG